MQVWLPPEIYQPGVEYTTQREEESIAQLKALFVKMASRVADVEGHAYRAVHAKGHALLDGTLAVEPDLPPELAHGLFARARSFPVRIRISSPPAEQLPDAVSTPRALALKVMHVDGERADEAFPDASQDFLMVNGPVFSAPDPAGFVGAAKLLASTAERMPRTKKVISATLRATEAALEALGTGSGKLKGLGGEPQRHPLGETYFTQVPFLYGPYMAKFSLAPRSPSLVQLKDLPIPSDDDAQRKVIQAFFEAVDDEAEWEFRVQLCRDLQRMPIEDSAVEWKTEDSPWLTVARVRAGAQRSWRETYQASEDQLAFSPWNALAAHRPLGAINRARRIVMAASREFRAATNGCAIREPGASRGQS